MLQSVGPQVLNGWNAFNAAITGGSVPLSDCDFFSVNVSGTWVGTLKWMASLDNVNWFDMALQNANGAVTPAVSLTSTGTDKNGNYFASAGSGLLYVRVVTSAWTSGTAYVYTAKHRGTYVSSQDFWDTAMPFTRDAVFAIDASRSSVGETVVVNAGSGGAVLNATLGSTGSADSNDPLLLPWTGTNYLYCPGAATNYASAPDSPALDITGDIEIVVRVAMDDWTPTADQVVAGKWQVGQYSWHFRVSSTGQFKILVSSDGIGTADLQTTGVPSPALVNGSSYWIRARYTLSNRTLVVGYSLDAGQAEPSVYDNTVTSAGGASVSVFSGTSILEIGSVEGGSALLLAGKFYRAIVRNGIGGTTVFDANFTTGITSGAQTTFTESSSNAATVTINRSTAGRKSVAVTRPVWLFGTDDYMEVADNALLNMDASQSFTVVAVMRQWATPAANGVIINKRAVGGNGWRFQNNGTALQLVMTNHDGIGTDNSYTTAPSSGALSLLSGIVTSTSVTAALNTLATGLGATRAAFNLSNTDPMRIGNASTGSNFQDFELLAVAVFRRALTATEIATINTYYGTA